MPSSVPMPKLERDRAQADHQREARAVQDAAEDVAAKLVGAQPVPRRYPREAPEHVLCAPVVRRDRLARDSDDQQACDDQQPQHTRPLPDKPLQQSPAARPGQARNTGLTTERTGRCRDHAHP